MVGAGGSSLIDKVREAVRMRHYSIRTEEAYIGWIRRYIHFHGRRHPREMGESQVKAFLSHLAVKGEVAASTGSSPACSTARGCDCSRACGCA